MNTMRLPGRITLDMHCAMITAAADKAEGYHDNYQLKINSSTGKKK